MRIAIVTDYYYPQLGGITEHVHGQATHLTALGHDVTVVTGHLTRPPAVVDDDYRPEEHATYEVVRIGQALRHVRQRLADAAHRGPVHARAGWPSCSRA